MTFTLPDPSTPFGAQVARHLADEAVVWLTTVGADGTPQPNPVWFLWDGSGFLIYSLPDAARLGRIRRNPRVALHFNSTPGGGDLVIFAGDTSIGPVPPEQDPAYVAKYRERMDRSFGGPAQFATRYSTPIRVTPTRLRGE